MHDLADAILTLAGAFVVIGIPMWVSWVLVEMFGFWAPLAVVVLCFVLELMAGGAT